VSVTAGGWEGGGGERERERERERELQGQDELKGKMFATLNMHLVLLPLSDPNCELSMNCSG
jgi:hypothetical protein